MASGLLYFPNALPSVARAAGGRIAAQIEWFVNGTTTPKTVYADEALTIPLPHPVKSNALGEFPAMYADTAETYTGLWTTIDGQSKTYDDLSSATPANQTALDQTLALRNETEDLRDDTAQLKADTQQIKEDTQDIYDDAVALYGSLSDINNAVTAAQASATSASGSATTATTQAGIATTQAGNAATSATNAATSATNAATSAGQAKSYTGGLAFLFSTTTTDSDPGAGNIRLNNASPASASFIYADDVDADGLAAAAWISTFDDSTSSIRGQLFLRDGLTGSFAVFSVTGPVVNGGGYRKIPVAYVTGTGAFTNTNRVGLAFASNGDAGSAMMVGYAAKSANYTLQATDRALIIDCTANLTLGAAAASALNSGWFCYVRLAPGVTVTIDPNASETIDGLTTKTFYQNTAILLQCDGSALRSVVLNQDAGDQVYARLDKPGSSTAAGDSASVGGYAACALNSMPINTIGATLVSNQITLPPGTYQVRARVPFYNTNNSQARVRNITDGTTVAFGSSVFTPNAANQNVDSWVSGRFTITAAKVFELQNVGTTAGTLGGPGVAVGGEINIFQEIWIERVSA